MGLITENNAQYYSGQQVSTYATAGDEVITWSADTALVGSSTSSNANYEVLINGVKKTETTDYSLSNNVVTISASLTAGDIIVVQLFQNVIENNYGGYAYITLDEVINNFLVAYVGEGKLIPSVKRTDVMFHAKRGLQEFSYDTLKSIKSQELTIPPSLSVIIPQDYVNYVSLSWIDELGVKRKIYPTTLTSNPTSLPIQDADGVPVQDNFSENIEASSSITEEQWKNADTKRITGDYFRNDYDVDFDYKDNILGQRYGAQPETSQTNGWFTINNREGKISFSSNLSGNVIILEYLSDGLAYDADTKLPKMAEEAMYAHLSYSILAGRANQPEYVVQRLKRDRSAKLRNTKIRLSNIKLSEIIQVMRNKSKQIKH